MAWPDKPTSTGSMPLWRLLACIGLAACCGCGGGQVLNTEFRRPASERPDLGEAAAASGSLQIPAKTALNFRSFPSGQEGEAQGASRPVGADGASCRAEARAGGSAWGEFQLGYMFDNATGRKLAALVKLRLAVTESCHVSGDPSVGGGDAGGGSAGGPSGDGTSDAEPASASNQLRFLVKDSNGLVLRDENLLAGAAKVGGSQSSRAHDLAFDVALESDRGYYFVLVGRSDARGAGGQSATASIDASKVSLEIDWAGDPVRPADSGAADRSADPAGR